MRVLADVEVKKIRKKLELTQDDFAAEFGFTIDQIKQWEQKRSRPLGGAHAYLMMIERHPEELRQPLRQNPAEMAKENAA